jgi:lipopolysaccharide transport system permease protein
MVLRIFSPLANIRALSEAWTLLRRHARLVVEMSRGDLTGRYKGQFFGSVWVIAHPLALTMLYLFIFGVVFSQRIGGTRELPLDYTAYILSGLIPWLTFQAAMNTSVLSIIGNSALVKQFIFPIEILPMRDVVSSTLTWLVGVSATLIYVVFTQKTVMATWALLPVVFTMQFLAMIGVAFILSAVAVFFKDIKDFVQLFCVVAIFLMPIVFLPGWVPAVFRPIMWMNPFTYMIWVYQDVIYFGRIEHPVAWLVFFGWAILAFAGGYRLFKRTKPMFGSLV